MKHGFWPLRLLVLGVALAAAQGSPLTVTDAWIRVTPGAPVAAAYLTLHNAGSQPVTVNAVHSPVAAIAMVHQTTYEKQLARMRPRPEVTVAPGQTLQFESAGLHVMLENLSQPLNAGQRVPISLTLTDGSSVTTTAVVRAAAAE